MPASTQFHHRCVTDLYFIEQNVQVCDASKAQQYYYCRAHDNFHRLRMRVWRVQMQEYFYLMQKHRVLQKHTMQCLHLPPLK